jgi:CHAD domain-containing protein
MSYQFEPDNSLQKNLKQIAAEQIDLACKQLHDPPGGDENTGVHEARKCFKRLRGLVRMARPTLGKKGYRQQNARFRDAGRALSTVRDAQALIESYEMLEQTNGSQVTFARMTALQHKLVARRDRMVNSADISKGSIDAVVDELDNTASGGIERGSAAGVTADQLTAGVQRVYRRARKGWKRAQSKHDPVKLHDWRKRAKYLRYHFQLLKGVDKKWASQWHKGFKRLSDLLGDHHDLDVLRQYLDSFDTGVMKPVAECEFRILLREKQDVLYREVLRLGRDLLHKKPKKVAGAVRRRLEKVNA